MKKSLLLLMMFILVASLLAACSGSNESNQEEVNEEEATNTDTTAPPAEKPLIEITAFNPNGAVDAKTVTNSNDVVTPYIEKKFNIKLNTVHTTNEQTPKERINQWIATNSLPDIIVASSELATYLVSTGEMLPLDDYFKDMPNVDKYFKTYGDEFWPRFMNEGKRYQVPQFYYNARLDEYKADPYSPGAQAWAIWAREDILKQLGYSFTPLAELRKTTTDVGVKPTEQQLAITPAIDSPEKFKKLLADIKALNLKVGDRSVIPFSTIGWSQFHLGSMWGYGHWELSSDGNVDGQLGSPYAKGFYKDLTSLYQQGLIDTDMFSQNDEQLQTKIASGQVASGLYIPDQNGAIQALASINPEYTIRYIPYPKMDQNIGYYDVAEPAFWRVMVKKGTKDPARLVELFNWSLSDEALDLLTWGPEEAGLWEIKDGKKHFIDPKMEDFIQNGASDTNTDPATKGLGFKSKIAWVLPSGNMGVGENPFWFSRSFDPSINLIDLTKSVSGASGVNTDGRVAYNDGGPNTTAVADYFWGKFYAGEIGKLLQAKTDADFDQAWEEIQATLEADGKYSAAKADMVKWFEANGPK